MNASSIIGTRAIRLYRSILREHRRSLPGELASLGDKFAEHEFRQHKQSKATPKQTEDFFREWESYVEALKQQTLGRDLDSGTIKKLSVEQQKKLDEMKEEIFK